MFGAQEQPYSLVDLSGNVWEWCLDKYEHSLDAQQLTQAEIDASDSPRSVRGGAFLDLQDFARVAYRDGYYPNSSDDNLGFRVSVSPTSL